VQTQLREADVALLAHYTSWMIGQNQDALRRLFAK
jgi:diphthamide biosynthesis methyltransferase